jgi:hypothetical protein
MGTFDGKTGGYQENELRSRSTVVVSMRIVSDKRFRTDGVRDLVKISPFRYSRGVTDREGVN